ncbi:hypothetical protein [Streptomyces griseus]|uniref:hypothetical protein n=1 Tax=Streptomyces griseus TaxID=1911 RepID=UPI00369A6021
MGSRSIRRVMVAASVVVASLGISVGFSGVANASPQRCEITMHNNGYIVGAKVKAACGNANASTSPLDPVAAAQRLACKAQLIALGVKSGHAQDACFSY